MIRSLGESLGVIESIVFSKEWSAALGLAGGPMRDLGDVVMLTGPNGGGKTRYLQLLIQLWARFRLLLLRKHSLATMMSMRDRVRGGEVALADLGDQTSLSLHVLYTYFNHARLQAWAADPTNEAAPLPSLRQTSANIDELVPQITLRAHELDRALERGSLPRTVILKYHRSAYQHYYRDTDGNDLCRDDENRIKSDYHKEKIRRVRMFRIRERLEGGLDHLARMVYMGEHPRFAAEHGAEIARATSIWQLLATWLGQPLSVESPRPDAARIPVRIGDRLLALEELSEGQQVLLTWALTLAEHGEALDNAIVLVDEPEIHLHPSAAITAITALRSYGVSQIWLATHSAALLAAFGVESLYHVHGGRIEYAGNRVEEVLGGLLGVDGRAQMRTFLADADDLAFHTFAAQSLVPPHSLDLRPGDPQAQQFTALFPTTVAGEPVRILDFAAGKGRLARAIGELGRHDHIRYHAYNDSRFTAPEDHVQCRRRIAELNQGEGIFYHDEFAALTVSTAPRMHAVVLCNVLHEIPVIDWLKTLHDIARVLHDDGALLLMEDQRMSRGELPHDAGFIVLDRWALCELFAVSPEEWQRYTVSKDDRLTLFRIPRAVLLQANGDTLIRALRNLAESTKSRLRSLRTRASGTSREGREHAYHALLLTNVMLALERYPSTPP